MRQVYKAGEKLFVDYCGMTVAVMDVTCNQVIEAQIFVASFGVSNYIYAEATPSQASVHWIGSHQRALEFFGGVPACAIPDNLKAGVTSACRYEPGLNAAYQEFAEHYQIAVMPARPRKPHDKSKVEKAVQEIERQILAPVHGYRTAIPPGPNICLPSTGPTNNNQSQLFSPGLRKLGRKPWHKWKPFLR